MKKIFTMMLGLALTAVVFAADKRPDLTITSMKKYEIVIDGKTYFGNGNTMHIESLRNGRHTIQVYETNRSFSFFKRKQLVSSRTFILDRKDVKISIDRYGQMNIIEERFGKDNRYGKDNKDWDDRNDRNDRNGRDRKF